MSNAGAIHPGELLSAVHYEIRGTLERRARELEAAGESVLKLNIGNPRLFGFRVPTHLTAAIVAHLGDSEAYCNEQGLTSAREAILAAQQAQGIRLAGIDHVFIGNGVSELIELALRALLNAGDEVLLPSPDYPLWSAATVLNSGVPCYYRCPASRAHQPDPEEIEALCTSRTRALVLVNPNNPTGAAYPRELLERIVAIAARHRLLILADEIYNQVLYEHTQFTPAATLTGDTPCLTFCGLSKVHRACGYRVGWMTLAGAQTRITALRDALQLLASLRLCANVPAQWAIEPALTGPDTISALTAPGGRLFVARRTVLDAVARSRFLQCVPPRGALYAFPAVRQDVLPNFDDNAFAQRLLEDERVLVVPGINFNLLNSRHFRLTLLPEAAQLNAAFQGMERVLEGMADVRPAMAQKLTA